MAPSPKTLLFRLLAQLIALLDFVLGLFTRPGWLRHFCVGCHTAMPVSVLFLLAFPGAVFMWTTELNGNLGPLWVVAGGGLVIAH